MKLTLSLEDIAALSDGAKHELAVLLGLDLGLDNESSNFSAASKAENDQAEELTYQAIKRFMSGVSPKTRKVLKLFAESEGATTVSEIENKMEEGFHWAGFMSGVTRWLRKLTGDSSAIFFQWDDGHKDWKSQKVSVSPMTCESLKKYFSIQ